MGSLRTPHDYKSWWGDDGHLYVQVIPVVWEAMTKETWSVGARRRARAILDEEGIDHGAVYMDEIDREQDWATDLPVTMTFRSREAFGGVQSAA